MLRRAPSIIIASQCSVDSTGSFHYPQCGVGRFSAHRASAPLRALDPEMAMGAPLRFPGLGRRIAGAVLRYLKNHRGVSKLQGQCEA